jgi:hypothetical protein
MGAAWLISVALGIQNGFLVSWGTGYVDLRLKQSMETNRRTSRHNADLDASIILIPTFKHW